MAIHHELGEIQAMPAVCSWVFPSVLAKLSPNVSCSRAERLRNCDVERGPSTPMCAVAPSQENNSIDRTMACLILVQNRWLNEPVPGLAGSKQHTATCRQCCCCRGARYGSRVAEAVSARPRSAKGTHPPRVPPTAARLGAHGVAVKPPGTTSSLRGERCKPARPPPCDIWCPS